MVLIECAVRSYGVYNHRVVARQAPPSRDITMVCKSTGRYQVSKLSRNPNFPSNYPPGQ